jgi:hypothetical protein
MTKYELLFNATGAPMELEDCWNGGPNFPEPDGTCPMNFFRVSADLFAAYGAVVSNILVAAAHAAKGQSTPGCWIHPDMLQVGVNTVPAKGGSGWPFLDASETRTHFGLWCVMSAPLILGFNVNDDAAVRDVLCGAARRLTGRGGVLRTHFHAFLLQMDAVWPVIANKEALSVNQVYAGDSGRLVSSSAELAVLQNCSFPMNGVANNCSVSAEMVFRKHLTNSSTAVLLVNNRPSRGNVTANWTAIGVECPIGGCAARSVWAHADLGPVGNASGWTVELDTHDSAFVVLTVLETSGWL